MTDDEKVKVILREVLDAFTSMVFVVDQDVRIQAYNAAVAELITATRTDVLQRRAGDVLHCIHASPMLGGCSHSAACQYCTIRNAVTDALEQNCIIRRRAKVQLISPQKTTVLRAVVSVSPFSLQESRYALVELEDFNEIVKLYRKLLICHGCGKLLDSESSWDWTDFSLTNNWNIDCSYSYCVDCFNEDIHEIEDL
ncbi:PAS domain-containing protein [Candidatus Electrothrix gigas]|jgi:PAS domain-containing protein